MITTNTTTQEDMMTDQKEHAARAKRCEEYEAEEREILAHFTKLAEADNYIPPRLPGPSSTR